MIEVTENTDLLVTLIGFRWAVQHLLVCDCRAIAGRKLSHVQHERESVRGAIALAPAKHLKLLGIALISFTDDRII
jgi:hypothetical protein